MPGPADSIAGWHGRTPAVSSCNVFPQRACHCVKPETSLLAVQTGWKRLRRGVSFPA